MNSAETKITPELAIDFFEKRWLHLGLIILLTFGVYANSFRNEFVSDDIDHIYNNNFIRNFQNLPKIFSKDYFVLAQERSYVPIVTLSYFLNYRLGRLNPFLYHFTNLLVHILNAILIYFLVGLMLSRSLPLSLHRSIAALLTALLFALHPVHTESVTFISGRTDLFAAFFFFLAFLFYLKDIFAISLVFFVFALFSKGMSVTLPLVLLLYDFCIPERRIAIKSRLRIYLMYFLILFFYLLGSFLLFRPTGVIFGVMDLSKFLVFRKNVLLQVIFSLSRIFVSYIKLLFFPLKLTIDHIFTLSTSPFELKVITSAGLLALLLLMAVKMLTLVPEMSFSVFYFFVTLLPVLNIIPTGIPIAERYLYIPSFGFTLVFTIIILKIMEYTQENRTIVYRLFFYALCVLLLGFYSLRTLKRNRDWKDTLTLSLATLRVSPESGLAYDALGSIYYNKGDFDRAIMYFSRAIKADPRNPYLFTFYRSLGNACMRKGWFAHAVTAYKRATELKPSDSRMYNSLGLAYLAQGIYEEAAESFQQALKIDPNFELAQRNYAEAKRLVSQKERSK